MTSEKPVSDVTLSGEQSCRSAIPLKDVRGWQFLEIKAAETLCMVCVSSEEHFFQKKYLGNRPFKKLHFIRV